MIKLVICMRRQKHLSRQAFQAHWLEEHSRFATRFRGVRRYVQYHTIEEEYSVTGPQAVDGVSAAWFDSKEAFGEELAGGPILDAARADEEVFVDASATFAALAEDQVVVEPESPAPLVSIEFLKLPSGGDGEAADRLGGELAAIAREAAAEGLVQGYIQAPAHGLGADDGGVSVAGLFGYTYHRSLAAIAAFSQSEVGVRWRERRGGLDEEGPSGSPVIAARHVLKDLIR
jgi:uncharacterized protein (TIGR02118 family)